MADLHKLLSVLIFYGNGMNTLLFSLHHIKVQRVVHTGSYGARKLKSDSGFR